jgi:hypothetical protein
MATFLPTPDDLNKISLVPALGLLIVDIASLSPFYGFHGYELAVGYSILLGIFSGFTQQLDFSIKEELSGLLEKNNKIEIPYSEAILLILVGSIVLSFSLTAYLLLVNLNSVLELETISYLFYMSLTITVVLSLSSMFSFTVFASIRAWNIGLRSWRELNSEKH